MIKMLEPMMSEVQQEAVITKRVLERVPADKLAWKPHAKSMSLGQLALHIATIPGNLSKLAKLDEFDASAANFDPPAPSNAKEILAALDASTKAVEEYLGGVSESAAMGSWRLTSREKKSSLFLASGCYERSCSTTGTTTAVNCRFTFDC